MIDINTILYGVEYALKQANIDPDLSYIAYSWDADNDNTGVYFPFVEIQATRVVPTGQTPDETPITDDTGGRIGTFYRIPWEATLQVSLRADADDPRNDARDLGSAIEAELYRYDNDIRATPLPDENGDPILEINEWSIVENSPADDVGSNPAIRQWITEIDVEFNKTIDSTDVFGPQEYVSTVITPNRGDFAATGRGNEVEADVRDYYTTS